MIGKGFKRYHPTGTKNYLNNYNNKFHFILSYLNTKPYQLKKKRETIQMSIYIYIKSYNFAGLPRDRASGRMLIL